METDIFDFVKGFFWVLVGDIPLLVISLTGIGISIFKYSKNPRIGLLSIIAFVILLFTTILWPALIELNFYLFSINKYQHDTFTYIVFGSNIIRSIFASIPFILLIMTSWKDRN